MTSLHAPLPDPALEATPADPHLSVHELTEFIFCPSAGIVAAGTGNGTLSQSLEASLREAQSRGVRVVRSTRCDAGPVMDLPGLLPAAGALSPVKARIELILALLAA